jgi:hypothetical protein
MKRILFSFPVRVKQLAKQIRGCLTWKRMRAAAVFRSPPSLLGGGCSMSASSPAAFCLRTTAATGSGASEESSAMQCRNERDETKCSCKHDETLTDPFRPPDFPLRFIKSGPDLADIQRHGGGRLRRDRRRSAAQLLTRRLCVHRRVISRRRRML